MTGTGPSPRPVRVLLVLGAAAHLGGLPAYDAFPFLYLLSIPLLAAAYYLSLRAAGLRPLSMPAFWGMAVVLAIPVAGPVAGLRKLRTLARGEGRDPLVESLAALLAAVPLAVVLAAVVLPDLPPEERVPMPAVLAVAAAAEAALFAAYRIVTRNRKKEDRP